MAVALLAILWLVAQTIAPAILSYALLCRHTDLRSDLAAALSVAVTPPLVGYVNGLAFNAAPYVLLCAVLAVAAVPRAALRWTREPFVRFWFAACCVWIGIDSWILVYGRGPMYIWDWRDHYHIAVEMTGAIKQGLWPVFLARGPLLGIWSSHAWLVAGGDWTEDFWVFQLTSLVANASLLGPVYLWAARDSARGGERALWAALLSTTIAYNVTYTWPRLWSPALVLTGMWVACEMRRLPGQILAGLILFAAFYAHLSAEVLIPLVGIMVWWATRRLPIAMTVTTAVGVGFWMWATVNIVHGNLFETYEAHRTGPHGFLVRTTGHLLGSLFPIHWERSPVTLFNDPTPFLLQYLSDVGIFALPLFVTALLFRRRGWNRMLIAAGVAAVLGGWIKSFFTFDLPLWLGLLTERFGEMALWLCAAAGAGTFRRHWTGPAWFLVSVAQALVVQGIVFSYNISSTTAVINPNAIHKDGGSPLLFLRDTQWGPIVGGALLLVGGVLLIRRSRAMCRPEAWQ